MNRSSGVREWGLHVCKSALRCSRWGTRSRDGNSLIEQAVSVLHFQDQRGSECLGVAQRGIGDRSNINMKKKQQLLDAPSFIYFAKELRIWASARPSSVSPKQCFVLVDQVNHNGQFIWLSNDATFPLTDRNRQRQKQIHLYVCMKSTAPA